VEVRVAASNLADGGGDARLLLRNVGWRTYPNPLAIHKRGVFREQ